MDGSQIGAFGLLLRKGGVERSPSTALPTVVGRGVRVSLVFGQSRTGTAALPGPWATGGRLFPAVGRCLSAGAEGGFCGVLSGTCEAKEAQGLAGLCSSASGPFSSPPLRGSLGLRVVFSQGG